jgi:hypothetical protein
MGVLGRCFGFEVVALASRSLLWLLGTPRLQPWVSQPSHKSRASAPGVAFLSHVVRNNLTKKRPKKHLVKPPEIATHCKQKSFSV